MSYSWLSLQQVKHLLRTSNIHLQRREFLESEHWGKIQKKNNNMVLLHFHCYKYNLN